MMKSQALAVVAAVAVLTSSVSAGNEFADTDNIPSKPNCNSKGSIATYLGQEVYFRKHPFSGSGTTPAYGAWNVPCDPAKKNAATGQAFAADAIKCSPTFAVNNGKDRMLVCIDSSTCPPNAPQIGEGTGVVDRSPKVNVAVPANVEIQELVNGICNRITANDDKEGLDAFDDGTFQNPEDQEPTNGEDKDVTETGAPLDQQIQACQIQLSEKLRALELEEQQAELQGADVDENNGYTNWFKSADGIAFRRSCGTRYIAFSGSDDLMDWVSDFAATPVLFQNTWFHMGFVGEYIGYNYENLKYITAGPNYIYAGHSLGGAIAQVAATHHKKLQPNQAIEYITHGTGAPFYKAQGIFAGNSASVWNSIPATNYINHIRTCNVVGGLAVRRDLVPSLLTGPNGLLQHKSTSITGLDEFSHWNWIGLCKQKTGVAVQHGWGGASTSVGQHFGDKYVERVNKLY